MASICAVGSLRLDSRLEHDCVSGDRAARPRRSHLADAESLRGLIGGAGLLERTWRDITADIVAARKAQHAKAQASGASGSSALPPLGMHLVLGEQAAVKMSNSGRNTDAGRMVFIQGVFDKPR